MIRCKKQLSTINYLEPIIEMYLFCFICSFADFAFRILACFWIPMVSAYLTVLSTASQYLLRPLVVYHLFSLTYNFVSFSSHTFLRILSLFLAIDTSLANNGWDPEVNSPTLINP